MDVRSLCKGDRVVVGVPLLIHGEVVVNNVTLERGTVFKEDVIFGGQVRYDRGTAYVVFLDDFNCVMKIKAWQFFLGYGSEAFSRDVKTGAVQCELISTIWSVDRPTFGKCDAFMRILISRERDSYVREQFS